MAAGLYIQQPLDRPKLQTGRYDRHGERQPARCFSYSYGTEAHVAGYDHAASSTPPADKIGYAQFDQDWPVFFAADELDADDRRNNLIYPAILSTQIAGMDV